MPYCYRIMYIDIYLEITFPVGCAVSAADSPVKVIVADGFDVFRVCPMEQLFFCDVLPRVILFHLVFLPVKKEAIIIKRRLFHAESLACIKGVNHMGSCTHH